MLWRIYFFTFPFLLIAFYHFNGMETGSLIIGNWNESGLLLSLSFFFSLLFYSSWILNLSTQDMVDNCQAITKFKEIQMNFSRQKYKIWMNAIYLKSKHLFDDKIRWQSALICSFEIIFIDDSTWALKATFRLNVRNRIHFYQLYSYNWKYSRN